MRQLLGWQFVFYRGLEWQEVGLGFNPKISGILAILNEFSILVFIFLFRLSLFIVSQNIGFQNSQMYMARFINMREESNFPCYTWFCFSIFFLSKTFSRIQILGLHLDSIESQRGKKWQSLH